MTSLRLAVCVLCLNLPGISFADGSKDPDPGKGGQAGNKNSGTHSSKNEKASNELAGAGKQPMSSGGAAGN